MTVKSYLRGLVHKAAGALVQTATGVSLTDLRLGLALSGRAPWSGRSMSVEVALQQDTVWACVRLISETIGQLPLKLYQQDARGNSTLATSHPLYPVLSVLANDEMSSMEFWVTYSACLVLWGNAYAQIQRGADGRIIGLLPLRPDRMQVQRDPNTGIITFIYSWRGQYFRLQESDVFWTRGFSLDGLVGMSLLSQAQNSLGTASASDEVAGTMFRQGMLAQSYIAVPNYLHDDDVNRAKAIAEDYSGAINAGRVPILEGGWSIKTIGINPEDLQLLQTRAWNVETICRWFDVPPPMVGHMQKSTAWGTGLEQMMLWFLTFSLQRHLVRIEQSIRRQLLTPAEQVTYYAKHNVDGLLRGDSAARAALFQSYVQNGIMTRNEVRALLELPPLANGDDLTVQAQMMPLRDLGQQAILPSLKPLPSGVPNRPAITGPEPVEDDE